ncbi:hypothetical protein [Escherichia coli]|nr:hypothetical protein [Escherichia coli]
MSLLPDGRHDLYGLNMQAQVYSPEMAYCGTCLILATISTGQQRS